ncbi:trypsin-like serine peptidase [Actinoplanes sp. NPDC051859]|uniref:trypsin-like serine peptidase n=1 Tax=Actinoplanes sp. NPDC051859 TaxID=3363909 RepID=UPI003787E5A5
MSIVAGACVALALAGTAGTVAWTYSSVDEGRRVGTWEEPAVVAAAPTPVALQQSAPVAPRKETAKTVTTAEERPAKTHESAIQTAKDGRQQIGTLLGVDKLLGYQKPQREVFRYPGASYVKLHFSRMTMLPGDYVTVSDGKGTESYRYDAPKLLDVAKPTSRWAMSITGDTAVLEVHRGGGALLSSVLGRLGVHVDQVAKGFTQQEQTQAAPRTGREESVCGGDESSDAVCYKSKDPVAYTRSKAIARLLINGTELCTGWRIGTKNRMLTNNHCFDNSADAYETEVWFNYQCAKCGGFDVFRPTKVWGDKVVATNRTYDYTLFTIENFKQVTKFGYLTLDTVRPVRGQELYVPQHPAGEPTRIAGRLGEKAGTCSVASNAFDGYAANSDVSYYCDTEGGSSGSPVLSRKTHKVVALHHFGGCPNSGVRADLLYNRIKSYI